jgi:hypothetical protein
MEEGRNTEEMSKKGLDAFLETFENGGIVKRVFSASDFSIKQLVDLEKLQEDELLTVELRTTLVPACFITVKVAEGVLM